ncbi:unnamed protein product [Dovyalis caffra]|uniref:At1g61320/AtMIF1 LRR domain-containing protein n=1 Tax=Dovyalis caffra TaxID=77055 RepID=A0AAV1R1V4_9ROSI|nr:unnamed protein product [Dovyalis caffra]
MAVYNHDVELDEFFSINLHSLLKLSLTKVWINDHAVRKLVASCPLIDDISLDRCSGFKNIDAVGGLLQLKKIQICLYLDLVDGVEIESCPESSHFLFSLRSEQHILKVDTCQSLKSLHPSSSFVTDLLFQHFASKFPVLESLTISECRKSKQMKISRWSLESWEISSCINIVDIEIDTPNLFTCNYHGFAVLHHVNGNLNLTCFTPSTFFGS